MNKRNTSALPQLASMQVGQASFWFRDIGHGGPTHPALAENIDVDVAIVGGGNTGLWTAFYLSQVAPHLSVAVLEAEFCGFGASGRNGGFLTRDMYWPRGEAAAYREMVAANLDSVNQFVDVFDSREIDIGQRRVGSLSITTTAAAWERLRSSTLLSGDELLDRAELSQRILVAGQEGAVFDPTVVRIHPAKMVTALRRLVEERGVQIYESTRVSAIGRGTVRTTTGHTVTAGHVVMATEAYSSSIDHRPRRIVPINTSMVVTEPIPQAVWDQIGWGGREMLDERRHGVLYSQVTEDGRLALGGRGRPYKFGSATDSAGEADEKTAEALRADIVRLFPSMAELSIDHLWCGSIGVPRDWRPSISAYPEAKLYRATGYVGNGVALTHLAGKTVADLIAGNSSPLTRLPWVNRESKSWEFEPLRYIGINGMYSLYGVADNRERGRSDDPKTSKIAQFASLISRKP